MPVPWDTALRSFTVTRGLLRRWGSSTLADEDDESDERRRRVRKEQPDEEGNIREPERLHRECQRSLESRKQRKAYTRSESKHGQDRRGWHLDIDTIAMVLEGQVSHLVDEEGFKGGVEERGRLEPLEVRWEFVAVDEESSEEETAINSNEYHR